MKKLVTSLLVLFQVVAAPLLVVAQTNQQTGGQPAVLYFSPPGESASTGNVTLDSSGNFTVSVKVNTHGTNSTGADVIVTFDNTQIQFVSGSMPGSGSGTFYPTVVRGVPTNTSTVNTNERISMARVIQAPEEGSSPTYTNGDGVFASLTFKPVATSPVGTQVTLGFDYTAGATNDSNVAGTDVTNPEILGNARSATLTIQGANPEPEPEPEPVPGANPVIDRIAPTSGEDTGTVQLAIYGVRFGASNGKVYVGGKQADVASWSDGLVTVIVPVMGATKSTEYLIRLVTSEGKEAVHMGYLVKTGLPMLPWLIMFPLNGAAAMLAKKRWFKK